MQDTLPKPTTLFGVRGWKQVSLDGSTLAPFYWENLPKDRIGIMGGTKGASEIRYFFDRRMRDDFIAIFGGESLTLNHKATGLLDGSDALAAVKRMNL